MSSTPKPPAAEGGATDAAAEGWTLAVRGASMRPLLKAGDAISVAPARAADVAAGDLVVLLGSRGGQPEYVAHRLLAWLPWRGRRYALTKGDGNFWPDRPAAASALVGRVGAARAGDQWLAVDRGRRRRALAFSALAAPTFHALAALDRSSETLARGLFHRALAPLGLSRAQAALLRGLAWRDRRLAGAYSWLQRRWAASTLGGPTAAPRGGSAPLPALGILEGATTWAGEVDVVGDVYVPPGASLRLAPGTRVRFAERSRWDYLDEARLSAPWGSRPGGPCRIFVAGRLLVEGRPQAPVRLGGPRWGGLHFVGDSIGSSLAHAELSGADAAVAAWDQARVALANARLSDCGGGASAEGPGAEVVVEDADVSRCAHAALAARRGRLLASRCRVSECGEGARAADGGRAELRGVELEGCGAAFAVEDGSLLAAGVRARGGGAGLVLRGGRAELERASVERCRRAAFSVERGSLAAAELAARACGAGLAVRDGRARLARAVIEDCEGAGLSIERGTLSAEDLAAARCGAGLLLRASRADLRRATVEECGGPGYLVDDSALILSEAAARGCEDGLLLRGGSVSWDGGTVERCRRFGLAAEGGSLDARRVDVADCGQVGALCGAQASVALRGGSIARAPVGAAARGARLTLEDVSVSQASDTAVVLDGRRHELRRVSISGACGLSCAGQEVDAAELEIADCDLAVRQRAGRLACRGMRARGCGRGLELSGGEAELAEASFETASWAVTAAGACALRWTRGEARGGGVRLAEGAIAELGDLVVKGCAGHAVEVDRSSLEARRLGLEDCALDGVAATQPRRLVLRRLSVRRCRFGASVRGGAARLESCSFEECSAAVRGEDADLRLDDVRAASCERGLCARGGATAARGLRLERCGAAAMEIDGGGRLSGGGIEASAAAVGLALAGDADLEDLRLRDCATGVDVRSGALRWGGGGALGGQTGLSVAACARADVSRAAFESQARRGAFVDGGSLRARDCSWTGAGEIALRLENEARLELERCRVARAPIGVGARRSRTRLSSCRVNEAAQVGLSLSGGRHELEDVSFHGCVDAVHADDEAVVTRRQAPARSEAARPLRSAARRWVLRTRDWGPLGRLYKLCAAAPLRLLQAWAALDRRVGWLGVHRSWLSGDWAAGTSDVDLVLCAGPLSDGPGRAWLRGLWRRLGALKAAFPFLGECLVAEASEWQDYRRWGGLRARAFETQAATLAGRLPAAPERAASAKAALEPFGEAAHAYTRLMAWAGAPASAPGAAAHATKAALDLLGLGHADRAGRPDRPPPRSTALAEAGASAQAYVDPLRDLAGAAARGEDDAGARARLRAAGLATLHGLAARAEAALDAAGDAVALAPAPAASGLAAATELSRRRALRVSLSRALGPALIAGCCDDLYRSWLVLGDDAAGEDVQAAFRGLDRAGREGVSTLPILLTRRAWRVWARLPYLESPLRFLEPGASGELLRAAGGALPGVWQYSWNAELLAAPAPPRALLLDLGREAVATLRCQWRFQASPLSGLSPAYALHYLSSRALSLRLLLEREVAAPAFGLDELGALYAREFPEDARALHEHWRRQAARDGAFDLDAAAAWADGALAPLTLP